MPAPRSAAPATPSPPPQDVAGLLELIGARRARLPRRLAQIADVVLARPREVAFARVAELAARAGAQPSAMIRFAQAFGYSGFAELRAVFRAHARERWPDYGERLAALDGPDGAPGGGDAASLLRGFMGAATTSVARLGESIDGEALRRAVAILADADTIHLLATRRSFPVVAYLTYALRRLALRCAPIDQSAGLAGEQIGLIAPRDVLLAVSFTPYAPLTLDLATAAAGRGVRVVAVTDSALSPLAKIAAVWLEVAEADHAGFRSLAGSFAVATTLAVAVAARRDARASDGTE